MDGGVPRRAPHRFSVTEYHRMAEAGILNEDSRVELIRGRIVDMSPIGAPHLGMVNRLTRLLVGVLTGRATISVQNPVRLDDGSEPQPDLAVLRPRADDYATSTPRPADVLLLIEVADSSLDDDRGEKVPLYAEHGIAECWIVNIPERNVEVHREPRNGSYASFRKVGSDGTLDIAALPGATFGAAVLWGPAPAN